MKHLQHITELGPLLERLNIRHVVIAPGSRNAPLIQLFTGNRAFRCHSIVDERSAGYVALGMARQLQQPVVVVTTSGTAVLNLGPAVAEAYYQKVPLIVVTADRPLESIRQFDNQVIDQVAPFFNHSVGFFEFPPELRSEEELVAALSSAAQLLREAVSLRGGPVHLNVPMVEPLYELLPEPALSGFGNGNLTGSGEESPGVFPPLPGDKKILVLAGMGTHDERVRSALESLVASGQTVVVAEHIANMPSDLFISNAELVLAGASPEERSRLAPDLVIGFGGQVVSKRLKLFLQRLKGVDFSTIQDDPGGALKALSVSSPGKGKGGPNLFQEVWKSIESRELRRAGQFLAKAPFCGLTAVQIALSSVPANAVVHLGNSSTVRFAQLMPVRKELTYFSNRGTSGIDGCVSSAVGAAMVSDGLHLLLVGDLSFVYDSNSLWNRNFPMNLKIIVLNDGGGGIFRLLDGPGRMDFFEEFSVTHHPVSLELLSQSFGRNFSRAAQREEFTEELAQLFRPGSQLSVLEVDTTGLENSRTFKEFMNQNI